jgi:hypothetical protein
MNAPNSYESHVVKEPLLSGWVATQFFAPVILSGGHRFACELVRSRKTLRLPGLS